MTPLNSPADSQAVQRQAEANQSAKDDLRQWRANVGAKRGKPAPDWFGCGRVITTESWNGFLAARKAYYEKQDRKSDMP